MVLKYVLLLDDRFVSSAKSQQPGDADERSALGPSEVCKSDY